MEATTAARAYSVDDKIAALDREIALRKAVYAKRVKEGRMRPEVARFEFDVMVSIRADYVAFRDEATAAADLQAEADEANADAEADEIAATRERLNALYLDRGRRARVTSAAFRELYDTCMEMAQHDEVEAERLLAERLDSMIEQVPPPALPHVSGQTDTPGPALSRVVPPGEAAMRRAMDAGLSDEGRDEVLRLCGRATVRELDGDDAAAIDELVALGAAELNRTNAAGLQHAIEARLARLARATDVDRDVDGWIDRIQEQRQAGRIGQEHATALLRWIGEAGTARKNDLRTAARKATA